jgi:hypothetical protein
MAVRIIFILQVPRRRQKAVDRAKNPTYMVGKGSRDFNPRRAYTMSENETNASGETPGPASDAELRMLTPAARRALEEAEARRRTYLAREAMLSKEFGGRGGKEPGRYGDWEIKGLTSDF